MRPRLYKGKVDGKCPFRRGKKRKLRLCEQILYTFPKHFQRFIVISTLKEGPGRQGEVGEEEKGGGGRRGCRIKFPQISTQNYIVSTSYKKRCSSLTEDYKMKNI